MGRDNSTTAATSRKMKSMFVFFLLVASAIAAPMEDQLALPSTEDVEAVIAQLEATQAEPEEVAQVAAAVEVAQVKLTVPVVDPAPIIKPKTRVPILASRFREKALATVSAPIPKRRKLSPVNAAAAAAKIVVPAVVAPVEEVVPVVSTPVAEEVAVIAPVEDVVAVVSTPVAVEEAVVTAVAPVALKPELVASVSAPVAGKKVKKTKKNGANQRKFRPYVPPNQYHNSPLRNNWLSVPTIPSLWSENTATTTSSKEPTITDLKASMVLKSLPREQQLTRRMMKRMVLLQEDLTLIPVLMVVWS